MLYAFAVKNMFRDRSCTPAQHRDVHENALFRRARFEKPYVGAFRAHRRRYRTIWEGLSRSGFYNGVDLEIVNV